MSHASPNSFDRPVSKGPSVRKRPGAVCLLSLAVALPALIVQAGCASGSQGLPSGFRVTPVTSLTINTAGFNPLPTGVVGVSYIVVIPVSGGTPSYGCSASPAAAGSTNGLPPGLMVTSTSTGCQISGTPLMSAAPSGPTTYAVGLSVSDSSVPPQLASVTLTLTINPAFTFINFTLGAGEVGVAFSQTFSVMGGVGNLTVCTLSPSIPGLSTGISGTSCTISGTPTGTFGPATATLTGQDTGSPSTPKSTTVNMTMLTIFAHVAVPAFVFPAGEVGAAYNLTIPTTGGILPLTACNIPGLPGALAVAANGANCVVSGTPAGAFASTVLTLTATDSGSASTMAASAMNSAALTVSARLAVPGFVLGTGEVGAAYNQSIPTTGGILPLTLCSIPGLPAGLTVTVSSPNCLVSGTPTAAFGPTVLTLTVTDSGSAASPAVSAMNSSSLTILARVTLAAFTLGNGEVNAAYSHLGIAISNGNPPYVSCAFASPAPAGLTVALNAGKTACDVTGAPTAVFGPATVAISVTDTPPSASSVAGMNTTTSTGTIQILARVTLAAFTLGNGEVNAAYAHLGIAISNGNPPYVACAFVGSSPAGLAVALNAAKTACDVTGTPTAIFAAATVTIMVTDTAPSADSAAGTNTTTSTGTIQIFAQVTLAAFTLLTGEVNAAYSHLGIAISNGSPPYAACAFVGSFPAGLTVGLNAGKTACDVTGTPTATFGAATVTIMVTDTAPSADSAAGTNSTTSSAPLTILARVTLAPFTLLTGEVNAAYSHLGIALSNGNPPYAACAFSGPAPAGLTVGLNAGKTACDVTGTPTSNAGFAPPTGATVTILVTDTAPSADSAAGTNTTTSSANLVILPALTINGQPMASLVAFPLGNGEQLAGYQNQTPIAIGGGTGAYTCAMVTAGTGLTATVSGATCQVFGAGGAAIPPDQPVNAATALFGAGTVTLNVADSAPPSADSAAGVIMPTSTSFQIFPGVSFANFTLGNGVQGFAFNQTGPPGFSGGNTAMAYTCMFTGAAPGGLTTTWNGTAPPGVAACNVTGAGGGNVATATFGPAQAMIQVKDTPRTVDQTTPSMKTANSQANFTIFPPLTVVIPAVVPNGLKGIPYSGMTFTATGGLSNGTNVTWTPPGSVAGGCSPPLGSGLPTGLTLNTSTGALTGTPTTAAPFTFMVCVEDNPGTATTSTNPAGVNSAAVTIKILGRLAFASGPGATVQVIDVSTNLFVSSIPLPGGSIPQGLAVTADGATVYVADSGNSSIIAIDAVTLTAGPSGAVLPGVGCAPHNVATTPDPTLPGHDRLYTACTAAGLDLLAFNITNRTALGAAIFDFPQTFAPRGVAIQGDNARAFIMVNTPCAAPTAPGFYSIDNTLSPPVVVQGVCLTGTTTMAGEISVVTNGAGFAMYVSRQSPSQIDVFSLPPTPIPATAPVLASFPVATNPDAIAADPLQAHVFVTLPGTNQFAAFDNTMSPPTFFGGGIFGLPTPLAAGTDSAGGVTIPPNSSGGFPFQAYFTVPASPFVDIIDNPAAPPPTKDAASPIVGVPIGAMRIASIPMPAAGLGLRTMTLPDAVTGRTYDLFAVIRSGKAPFTCSANGLPAGLAVAFNTVPVAPPNPFAGKPACEITGTAPGAGTSVVTLTVMDSTQTTPTSLNFTIRSEFAFNAPTPLPDGIVGRTYGVAPQTAPVETTNVSATMGNSPLTICTVSGTGGNPSLTSAVSAATGCSLSSAANLAAAQTDMLTFNATDSPIKDPLTTLTVVNAKTIPSGTVNLVVDAALALMTGLPGPSMAPWTAKTGAATGTQPYLNATPSFVVLTTGGLPSAQTTYTCMSVGFAGLGLTVTNASANSPNCALSGTPNATGTNVAVSISVSDSGNSAVPGLVPAAMTASMITINSPPSITTASPLPAGVTNTDSNGASTSRPYSFALANTGGTGPFTFSNPNGNLGSGACTGLSINGGGTVSGTPSQSITQPATGACMFNATVTDSTGTMLPAVNFTITIHPPLRVTPNVNVATQGIAVVGRTYGMPAMTDLIFQATGGLTPYTSMISSGTPPGGITCTGATGTLACNSGGAAVTAAPGTQPFMVHVTDSSDAAVASTDSQTTPETITVNTALTINSSTIPNGLVNVPYTTSASATLTAANGLSAGGLTWFMPGSTCLGGPVLTGSLDGMLLGAASGTIAGTPTAVSTGASLPMGFAPQICVTDTADMTTPAGSATKTFSLVVMNNFAYAAGTGTNTVEVFGTAKATAPNAPVTSIALTSTPDGIDVTPNGRFVITAEHNPTDQIDVIDTITNAKIAGSPFTLGGGASNCVTPAGVGADTTFTYVACRGGTNEVLVLNTATLTSGGGIAASKVTEIATGATVPDSIAFNTARTRAYVTLSGNDQVMVINNTLATPASVTTFTLPAGTDSPRGIAVLQNTASGTKDYAYIAKQTAPSSAIAFVSASNSATCLSATNGSATTVTCTVATSNNNTVIVMVASRGGQNVSTVTDTGGSTYSQINTNNPCTLSDGTGQIECWATAPGTSKASVSVTVTLAAATNFVVSVVEYSGVQSFGNVNTKPQTNTGTPSVSVNTQDNNNFCVAGFTEESNLAISMGASGTLRNTRSITGTTGAPNVSGAAVDNTVAAPGACNAAVTNGGTNRNWVMASVELRSSGSPAVDVVDVTTDTLATVTSISEPGASQPFGVAGISATPSGRAYVTLLGSNQFDVIDNTVATPVRIAGGPFNLPDPTLAAAAVAPVGVVIPPSNSSPVQAYITFDATGQVGIIDNNTPPTINATAPFTLTGGGGSAPSRVANIPLPH